MARKTGRIMALNWIGGHIVLSLARLNAILLGHCESKWGLSGRHLAVSGPLPLNQFYLYPLSASFSFPCQAVEADCSLVQSSPFLHSHVLLVLQNSIQTLHLKRALGQDLLIWASTYNNIWCIKHSINMCWMSTWRTPQISPSLHWTQIISVVCISWLTPTLLKMLFLPSHHYILVHKVNAH